LNPESRRDNELPLVTSFSCGKAAVSPEIGARITTAWSPYLAATTFQKRTASAVAAGFTANIPDEALLAQESKSASSTLNSHGREN
jgi:hypothetical protein